jgi:CRP-like cAMP-binding protein
MSDRAIAGFLAGVPLLEGHDAAELAELARVLRRRTVRAGATLWSQGDDARELLFIVEGCLAAVLDLPGDRALEIGRAGRGEVVGEIGLLEGTHTMSLRATADTTVLALGRLDFTALLAGRRPSAFALRRRLAAVFTARIRIQVEQLAGSLGAAPDAGGGDGAAETLAGLERCGPPDSRYMRRMTTFHDFDPLSLWGFLTSGTYVRCPAGRTLLAEGETSPAYYLTINGAVEKVLVRGDRRIRVGLAGPGKAFGYEGLIDDRPSPVGAIARERAVLLVLPRELFVKLFGGEDAVSRGFLGVIQRDLTATLRETLRPAARLAASV